LAGATQDKANKVRPEKRLVTDDTGGKKLQVVVAVAT